MRQSLQSNPDPAESGYALPLQTAYSKTCVRQPPLKLTLVVDVER